MMYAFMDFKLKKRKSIQKNFSKKINKGVIILIITLFCLIGKSSFFVDFLVQQYWFLNLLENFYIQTEISNNIKILIMIEIIMQKIYKKLIKYL